MDPATEEVEAMKKLIFDLVHDRYQVVHVGWSNHK